MTITEECVRLIWPYLTVHECIQLRLTGHCMDFLVDEETCRAMVQTIIAPVQLAGVIDCPDENVFSLWADTAKDILEVPTFKGLLQCFYRFPVPLVGYWREIPRDIRSDYRGELLRIRPAHDRCLIAESLEPSGAVKLRFTVSARYNPIQHAYFLQVQGLYSTVSMRASPDGIFLGSSGSTQHFSPVPRPLDIKSLHHQIWYEDIRRLLGFVIAAYATHGLETLFINFGSPNDDRAISSSHGIASPRLEGLKVIGDCNVPASQFSFVIDLSRTYDPNERLTADQRPVLTFPMDFPVIVNLQSQLPDIQYWFRGKGQINRISGRWQPEWTDVNLIVYRCSNANTHGAVFTIVWDDNDNDSFRHAILYTPLDTIIEPNWLDPPTLNVEEVMNAEDPSMATSQQGI